jgi:hypothetical protein
LLGFGAAFVVGGAGGEGSVVTTASGVGVGDVDGLADVLADAEVLVDFEGVGVESSGMSLAITEPPQKHSVMSAKAMTMSPPTGRLAKAKMLVTGENCIDHGHEYTWSIQFMEVDARTERAALGVKGECRSGIETSL